MENVVCPLFTGRRREVLDVAVEKLGKSAIDIQADAAVKVDMQHVADH